MGRPHVEGNGRRVDLHPPTLQQATSSALAIAGRSTVIGDRPEVGGEGRHGAGQGLVGALASAQGGLDPDGPTDLSASVKAYMVCKWAGHTADEPFMRRAREVILAKGGASLIDAAAIHVLKRHLFPLAALVTPNIPEAQALTGVRIDGPEQVNAAIDALLSLGPAAVLLKGGHLPGDEIVDVVRTIDGDERRFSHGRIFSTSTHGTGCTLASAIATGIAEGLRLVDSVVLAEQYVRDGIRFAPGFGKGHGPLDHAYPLRAKPQDTAEELAGENGRLPTGNA